MGHYQSASWRITREQRYGIYTLLKTDYNQSEIAAGIGVHKSTISRELRRNPAGLPGLAVAASPVGYGQRATPRLAGTARDGGGTKVCGDIWFPRSVKNKSFQGNRRTLHQGL